VEACSDLWQAEQATWLENQKLHLLRISRGCSIFSLASAQDFKNVEPQEGWTGWSPWKSAFFGKVGFGVPSESFASKKLKSTHLRSNYYARPRLFLQNFKDENLRLCPT